MRYLSVCSGIEAATVAWHPLGWQPTAFSEIEPFPSAVLAHHYPTVPNLGDMTKFKEWNLGPIDLLVGGTPCQSFSVAGLRKGLDDPRGNLMLTYLAIADQYRPRWLVWENVPGVLSSNGGKDFGTFLGGLGELGYGFAYRVLDAQYFGVAQRRRRVFVVGYLGDWRRAAAVLFERHSLSGNPAPRRQAGQGITHDTAPCLTSSGRGVERTGETRGQDPVIAVQAFGENNTSGPIDVATARNACASASGRMDFESETFIAHTLKGEGFDASEDGTGRGTPLVPVHTTGAGFWQEGFGTLRGRTQDSHENLIAFSSKDYGNDAQFDVAPTLRSMNADKSHANGGGQMAVAFNLRGREGGAQAEVDGDGLANIRAASGGSSRTYVSTSAVRRLTPVECERLQGFPDDYTRIQVRGKPAADGPRYKALGNSMAVPVMAWIGQRIQSVEDLQQSTKQAA